MRYLPVMLMTGSLLAAPAGLAEERTGAMEARPQPSSKSWVKLCETPATASKDLFGRVGVIGARTCLTHQEQLDRTNGAVLVAAGLRQTGGRQTLTVMVPTWVFQPPGMRVYIYPSSLWAKLQRKERISKAEVGRLGTVSLKYAFCHAEGCTAETDASPELVADLKSNAGLVVGVIRSGRPVAFALTLSGFREAYDGAPTDSTTFRKARAELLRKLREREPPPHAQPPRRGEQRI